MMTSSAQHYYKRILNYLRKYTDNKSDTTSTSKIDITNSKVDFTKINELVLQEYSIKLLKNFKQDYEKQYMTLKNQEKAVTIHTPRHHKIIDQVHTIIDNITKLNDEIDILSKNASSIEDSIRKDLQLKDV